MKRILSIILIFLIFLMLASVGHSFALDVPPPPIDIDISNSKFEVIDSTQFRMRQILAPGYPGAYWADFLWNRDQLLFQPTNVGEESSSEKIGVAIVGKGGGFYPDPIAAMNDIATWCGTPSSTNPCLVKILPGVYDIGTTLIAPSYVDIEGSGEKVTRIRGHIDGTVIFAGNIEMRFLTVENMGGGDNSTAISGGPQVKLSHVTAMASGGVVKNYGFFSTSNFENFPPFIEMTNVVIKVTNGGANSVNYGIFNVGGLSPQPLSMKNVTITVIGGAENFGVYTNSGATIDSSSIRATTIIYNNSVFTAQISSTLLDGLIDGPGPVKCAGVYDENFVFYANTCP